MFFVLIFCKMNSFYSKYPVILTEIGSFFNLSKLPKYQNIFKQMHTILQKIIENKNCEIIASKKSCPIETLRKITKATERNFQSAIKNDRSKDWPKLIAEFKRKSPSKKDFSVNPELKTVVEIYNQHAAAISILTDHKFFGGKLEDIKNARAITDLPILRKDFIFDEYQIFEARQFGADAVLLIARILETDKIESLLSNAKKLGMSCLVEIHDETDLEKVLATSAEIIGVNSRDLDTLEINLGRIFKLVAKIPPEKIIVAESGILSRNDFEKLVGKVSATLIGSSLLNADNLHKKILEFKK